MIPVSRRAPARQLSRALALALPLLHVSLAVKAQPNDEDVALEPAEAADLAVASQPLLQALEAQTLAAHETAVVARQLPDPQLLTGIADLPVNTGDAYSFTRDSDTQVQVSLMQEFPRAQKRQLRSELYEREAARLSAEHRLAERTIRRDAALAWLELWRYERLLSLTRVSLREAETQMQSGSITTITSGSAFVSRTTTARCCRRARTASRPHWRAGAPAAMRCARYWMPAARRWRSRWPSSICDSIWPSTPSNSLISVPLRVTPGRPPMNRKTLMALGLVVVVGASGGWWFAHQSATPHKHQLVKMTDEHGKVYYTCPMHPQVKQGEPGSCPICGMKLVKREEKPAVPQPLRPGYDVAVEVFLPTVRSRRPLFGHG